MKEVKLIARDAKKRDVGTGIARISRLVRKQLNVEIGDAVGARALVEKRKR
jgi:hypothetical protein